MKSLLEVIRELNVRDWYYYFQVSQNPLKNPFRDKIGHVEFIKKYFKRSGKEKVLQKFDVNNFLPQNAPHTNSVFFIGAYLYYNTIFKDKIENSLTLKGYRMFPFIWFLITLFHDFGYKYENKFDRYRHIVDIETLMKELDIKYNLLRYKKIKGVSFTLYNNIRKYFRYRRFNSKYNNKIDHGVLAGMFFYDALVRNRIIQYNKKDRKDLYFGPELNKIYAQAAAVIATHNIWLPIDKNKSEYLKFGLEELVGMPPINLIDSPLLVLLGIVDTIDPVKIYRDKFNRNEDHNKILDSIMISCSKRKITLKNSSRYNINFNKTIEKANNLLGWLDVMVDSSADSLSIQINT